MIKSKKILVSIHFLVWVIYLCLPVFVISQPAKMLRSEQFYVISYILSSCLSILFFYYNYLWAIPRFVFQKKIVKYLLSNFIFILFLVIIVKSLNASFMPNHYSTFVPNSFFFVNYPFRFALLFGVSFG